MKKETMSGNGFLQALILWMVIQDLQVLQVLKLIEGLVDEMTGSEVAECEVTTLEGTVCEDTVRGRIFGWTVRVC